jgi:predicted dehydrogenase
MLDIGIIGLGPDWEQRYLPALGRLRRRLRVRFVYCATASLAEAVAAQLSCEAAGGLMAMFQNPACRAVLMLDTAWMGVAAVELAIKAGRPVYAASYLGNSQEEIDRLCRLCAESGATLMPDFAHRTIPATARLQELMATRLGRPTQVHVEAEPADQANSAIPISACIRNPLLCGIDWCNYLMGTAPREVAAKRLTGEEPAPERAGGSVPIEISVNYQAHADKHVAPRAVIRFLQEAGSASWMAATAEHKALGRFRARVACQRGEATIGGPTQIAWSAGGETAVESLTFDRSEVDVMLDHFARRVVGGLIPIPGVQDLNRALALARAAGQSLQTGKPVALEP